MAAVLAWGGPSAVLVSKLPVPPAGPLLPQDLRAAYPAANNSFVAVLLHVSSTRVPGICKREKLQKCARRQRGRWWRRCWQCWRY